MGSGFFDEQFRLTEISNMGDPLEELNEHIDFESFRELLESGFAWRDPRKGGRPSFDKVMMFKGLLLKSLYNLSFEKLEYHIKDRLSFQRFLGLNLCDRVPDGNTFWDFTELLTDQGIIDKAFEHLNEKLKHLGLIMNKGSIVDANIVDAPKQRNSREENDQIKQGNKPSDWSAKKSSHKDLDADWIKKHGVNRYGYKNHIKMDKKSKLITNFEVSSASVHDSLMLPQLLDKQDAHHELYGDSAYRSGAIEEELKQRKIISRIHKRSYRNNPLSEKDKVINKNKSRIRARVEHVFGDMKQTMGQIVVRQIGLARNTAAITMMNISYNMRRAVHLLKPVHHR